MLIAACAPEEPVQVERKDPVVVYAAFEETAALTDVFSQYTEETGELVIVRRGAAANIVDDLIENRISPPADMLMTQSVVDAWRAAEKGALRPLYSETMRARVPEWARDADGFWFGTSFQSAAIVHKLADFDASSLPDFAALAEQRFKGSLCLTSSALAINRAVIAMMISERGVRSTEIIVRDWIKNLAVPPFDDDEELIAAVAAGICGVGIASFAATTNAGLSVHVPPTTYADVAALGVARHARNPDGAVALAEWLVTEVAAMQIYGDANVSRVNVSLVALNNEEAARLAERARYR